MAQNNMITKEDYAKYVEAQKIVGNLENKIIHRLTDIFIQIWGNKNQNWYVSDAPEGSVGDVSSILGDDCRYIDTASLCVEPEVKAILIFDKDNEIIDLRNAIPFRWLFEDFTEELETGKKKYAKHIADQKTKKINRAQELKIKKQKKVLAIRDKLTDEEKKDFDRIIKKDIAKSLKKECKI